MPNRTIPIPRGTVIKEAPLPAPLLDADVIVDVPKAKNHHVEPITGALKNWVGTVNRPWRTPAGCAARRERSNQGSHGSAVRPLSTIAPPRDPLW